MATYTGSDKRLQYLFQNGGGGGGASALVDLTDVSITTPTDGQTLLYDATNGEWENGNIPQKVVYGYYRNGNFHDLSGRPIAGEVGAIYVGEDRTSPVIRPRSYSSAYVYDLNGVRFYRIDNAALEIAVDLQGRFNHFIEFPFGVVNNQYGYYTDLGKTDFHPFNENIYACDLLLDNTDFSITSGTGNVNRDYTLSASANDYDAVVVMGYIHVTASTKDQIVSVFVPKGAYLSGRWQYLMGFDTRRLMFGFTSNGRTIQSICVRNANEEPRIYRVYGLKFGSSGTGSNKHTYSTTEQVVGTWIDGKPIYEKTISGTTIIGGQNDYANHGISALETVVDSCIMAHFSDIDSWRRLNFSYNNGSTNNAWLGGYAIMPTQIMFQIGTSLANTLDKWNATIRYTKSTD